MYSRMAAAPYARRALPASTVHGLLLVATLGNPRYLSNVGRSVHSHFSGWDCIAYMHSTAPLNATFEHCRVVRRYGWGWASLLNLTTPAVVAPYTHVCVLLDDVILPTRSFRLTHVLATMHAFKLDVASPAVLGGHFSGTDPPQINSTSRSHPAFLTESLPYPARATNSIRTWWRRHAPPAATSVAPCVRTVPLVEVFVTFYTSAAWLCLWSLFDHRVLRTPSRALGSGYAECLGAHCVTRGVRRQGVILSSLVFHPRGRGKSSLWPLFKQLVAQMGRLHEWVNQTDGRPCVVPHAAPPDEGWPITCAPADAGLARAAARDV